MAWGGTSTGKIETLLFSGTVWFRERRIKNCYHTSFVMIQAPLDSAVLHGAGVVPLRHWLSRSSIPYLITFHHHHLQL